MLTGNGPYRRVRDAELRDIFYLTPQTGKSFWFVPSAMSTTAPPPGTEKPSVTELLRALLYLHASPAQPAELRRAIETRLTDRNDIAIRAKLLSLTTQVREKPWAYPACLSEPMCRRFYSQLKSIAGASEAAADTLGDPFSSTAAGGGTSYVTSKLPAATRGSAAKGFGIGFFAMQLVNFFGGKSKDYHEFYMKRISDELALRGIPPNSL